METRIAKNSVILGVLLTVCAARADEFLVIDVSAGKDASAYPVEKLKSAPAGKWSDEYKTSKIVLKKVSSGDKAFYIGVFEVTQRQWELVTGKRPSYYKNDECYAKRPVENVSYDDIRGKHDGTKYPDSREVDLNSFVGLLRAKANLPRLDLPTERQWRIACSEPGGGNDAENLEIISRRARMGVNGGYYLSPRPASPGCTSENGTAEVGSYEPNGRGLYDMHGNVLEWCVDSCDVSDAHVIMLSCTWPQFRPFGRLRVLKGGQCESSASYCRASIVYGDVSSFASNVKGLRLAIGE